MSNHISRLAWKRGSQDFTYETYVRDHRIKMATGLEFSASAAPEYRGTPTLTNPEELLVAALSSCHMLTFLAVAAKKGHVVESYDDEAIGVLEKNETGPIHVTRVVLHPRIVFGGTAPDADAIAKMHEQAHRGCFIANSVRTVVTVEPATPV